MAQHPALIATQNWLDNFIIALGICPFARREGLRYCLIEGQDLAENLQTLADELDYLEQHPDIQTTLVVFANALNDFDDYLDALELAEQLLVDLGFEGIYQLASFHPDYQFDGEAADDAANYTNRSPFPMWHIIRESSISNALQHFKDPERIPQRNIELTRDMGLDKLKALLAGCYAGSEDSKQV